MLLKFLQGVILGLIVVVVNYFSSPQKKMTKTKRLLLTAAVCLISGLLSLVIPD